MKQVYKLLLHGHQQPTRTAPRAPKKGKPGGHGDAHTHKAHDRNQVEKVHKH